MPKGFEALPIAARPPKPRERGLVVTIDWGLGLVEQADLLRIAGEYIDLAKIAVGVSRLLDAGLLREKIALYRQHAVVAFPGGQFLEYALAHGATDTFLTEAGAVGYEAIEVSDNLIEISLDDKTALIARAVQEFGLRVLGEAGKKEGLAHTAPLVDDARACLAAGAWKVMLEAADVFPAGQEPQAAVQSLLAQGLLPAEAIFELPGHWIPGTTYADPPRIYRQLARCSWPGGKRGQRLAGSGHRIRDDPLRHRRQRREWCGYPTASIERDGLSHERGAAEHPAAHVRSAARRQPRRCRSSAGPHTEH